jgi:hypothetical protein
MSEDSIRVSPGRPVGGSGRSNATRDLERQPLALIVMAVLSIAILIAAQVDDGFDAHSSWLYVTILGAAYIISRGLADRDHHH